MAWYNPATWTPVDMAQDAASRLLRGGTTVDLSQPGGLVSGQPFLPSNLRFNSLGESAPQSSGSVSGVSATTAPTADQQASFGGGYSTGGATAPNPNMDVYQTMLNNARQSGTDWGNAYAPGYQNTIQNYINRLRQGQQALDTRGTQNELALHQGRRSILDMVGQGIRSGGVNLAGRNAAAGSALGQVAKAYGQYGNRQLANIGNQYAQGNTQLGVDQANFSADIPLALSGIKGKEQSDVLSAVSEARDRLASLQAWAADKSLPVQLDVAAETQAIQDKINSLLGGYTSELDTGVAGINPMSVDQRKQQAFSQYQQGTTAANPFDFSTDMPLAFQNTGPVPGGLPIFTAPRKKNK